MQIVIVMEKEYNPTTRHKSLPNDSEYKVASPSLTHHFGVLPEIPAPMTLGRSS
jgi:hypothetical protein